MKHKKKHKKTGGIKVGVLQSDFEQHMITMRNRVRSRKKRK